MPGPDPQEAIRPPEFLIDTSVDETERVALEGLQRVMHSHPDIAQESLDLYFTAPDTAKRFIAFMRSHPEGGLGILEAVEVIVDNKLDMSVEFDEATEAAVAEDAPYKAAVEKFRKSGSEDDRTWFRRRRLSVAVKRAQAAKEAA